MERTVPSPRILAVANQKGGVGKTTTSINLAASLAALGRRVLLVDLDPQANASSGLGHRNVPGDRSVYGSMIADDESSQEMQARILSTDMGNLSVLPASRDLAAVEVEFVNLPHREYRLRAVFDRIDSAYDDILIDCPPSLGLLTLNGLCAAQGVLIPLQCEYFALEGVSELVATLRRVKSFLHPAIEIAGVLLTMYSDRTNLARSVEAEIRSFFKNRVYTTTIPRNVRLAEAPSFGKPAILHDIKSRGSEAYLQLAKEILRHDKAQETERARQGS